MATAIPTQGFQMSRLPEFAQADPRDYAFDRRALEDAISFVPRTLEGLEQISDRRFELGTKRATRGSRRSLAERTADAALEDFEPTRENMLAGLEADTAGDRARRFASDEELTNAQVNADINAQTAQQDAINKARKAGQQPEEERRRREMEDAAQRRADESAAALAESRRMNAGANMTRAGVAETKAEVDTRYREALIRDVDARARTRGGRVVDSQPVRFNDGIEAMVVYVQTIDENGQPVIKPEFHELPQGAGFTRPQEAEARRTLPPGMDLRTPPAGAAPAAAPAPTAPTTDASLPILTPEQAAQQPPGTRFRTTDGRILTTRAPSAQ